MHLPIFRNFVQGQIQFHLVEEAREKKNTVGRENGSNQQGKKKKSVQNRKSMKCVQNRMQTSFAGMDAEDKKGNLDQRLCIPGFILFWT